MGEPESIHRGSEVHLDLVQGVHRIELEGRRIVVAAEVEEHCIAVEVGVRHIVVEEGVHRTAGWEVHHIAVEEEVRHTGCSQAAERHTRTESGHAGTDQEPGPIVLVAEVERHKVLGEVVDHKTVVEEAHRRIAEVEVRSIHLVEVEERYIRPEEVVDNCYCSTT